MSRDQDSSAHHPELPWYAAGLRFSCQRCGQCCAGAPGAVWIEPADIPTLARALELDEEIFARQYLRHDGRRRRLYEWPGGDCVLFDGATRGCGAHAGRPAQCRAWPFWRANLESPRAWQRASEQCPGCGQGELYELERIEQQAWQRSAGMRPV